MKLSSFSKELKAWRGKRGQKEVCDKLGWNLRTYEGWELGRNPSRFRINELRRQMSENTENKIHHRKDVKTIGSEIFFIGPDGIKTLAP